MVESVARSREREREMESERERERERETERQGKFVCAFAMFCDPGVLLVLCRVGPRYHGHAGYATAHRDAGTT